MNLSVSRRQAIALMGVEVQKRFGVKLEHVKITDTAEVVKRVRSC